MPLTTRHLRRYRQIVEVFVRHGFGAAFSQLNLEARLGLPSYLFRRKQKLDEQITPAQYVRLALEELGPTFTKFGQILSTRPDLLPPEYIEELSHLQDRIPPTPWKEAKVCIEEEWGRPIEDVLGNFSTTPLAAASLSQVYAALLPQGEEVVIKVQRPSIEENIHLDLDILHDLARLAQERTPLGNVYNLVDVADDFALSLRAEMDYRREGRNADRFRANFEKEPNLHVPLVYWDYTTRRVLVQERIRGIKVDNIAALKEKGYDCRQIARQCAQFIIKEILEDGFFHADPHPGNIVVMEGQILGVMDFGMVGRIDQHDRINLVRLYSVIVQGDTDGIIDQLIRMGVANHRVNRLSLRQDIRRLMIKYYGLPLNEIYINEIIEDLNPIVYRHRLYISSDLWLLLKTLAMMEGVGKKLDPEFDLFAEFSGPYARRFLLRQWVSREWWPPLLRNLTNWGDLFGEFPRYASRILAQAEQGDFEVRLNIPELKETTRHLNRIANRLIVSILLAAFIVALAMLIPLLNLDWPWGVFTWIIVLAYLITTVLGIWLIWSILRSGMQ